MIQSINPLDIEKHLAECVANGCETLFGVKPDSNSVVIGPTNKDHNGHYTITTFNLSKLTGKNPQDTADLLGKYISEHTDFIQSFEVVKGFLNLSLKPEFWKDALNNITHLKTFGRNPSSKEKIVLEYCGPNTNKPLHLGHVRNMLIGFSMAEILKANGSNVDRVNIYNDRGIAICKSMLGWIKYGNGETPDSTQTKGDHFVGKFYVEFEKKYKEQVAELIQGGLSKEEAEKKAPLKQEADEMLLKWEAHDPETLQLWNQMNNWVYQGFQVTYDKMGIAFEKEYYESKEWTKGKELIQEGLDAGVYFTKEDGSVWVDLSAEGLDQKILLRSDGTSVYLTQDLGMIKQRWDDYHMDKMIYVVADEQNYHFKVLKLALQKLNKEYANAIFHLSYGLVELPSGRMKTREGTVVDADDLVEEMLQIAENRTIDQGKIDGFTEDEKQNLYRQVGLAALKFFILKVNPKKKIIFNPEESIDFQGFTGPFVQYTHARICSILRKAESMELKENQNYLPNADEQSLIFDISRFPQTIRQAASGYDPSEIATYSFNLAKEFNRFYDKYSILGAENADTKAFRIQLAAQTARTISLSLSLLGIEAPTRM